METQDELKLEIGTKEVEKLKPKDVEIVEVQVKEVGDKGNKKIVCSVRHPDKEETIDISSVKFERDGKLRVSGLFINKDEDKLIKKGSALATLINFVDAKTPEELKGKKLSTVEDEKGYLVFKCY